MHGEGATQFALEVNESCCLHLHPPDQWPFRVVNVHLHSYYHRPLKHNETTKAMLAQRQKDIDIDCKARLQTQCHSL